MILEKSLGAANFKTMKLYRLLFGMLIIAGLAACGNGGESDVANEETANGEVAPKKEKIKVDFELKEMAKVTSITDEKLTLEDGDEMEIPYSEDFTTIVLVKHGDKNPEQKKLQLNADAQKIADKIKNVLGGWTFDAGYGFDQSANQTIRPITRENKASFSVYTGDNQETFLQHIVSNNKGKKVLLVGTDVQVRQLLTLLEGKQQSISGMNNFNEIFLVFANDIGNAAVNRMIF